MKPWAQINEGLHSSVAVTVSIVSLGGPGLTTECFQTILDVGGVTGLKITEAARRRHVLFQSAPVGVLREGQYCIFTLFRLDSSRNGKHLAVKKNTKRNLFECKVTNENSKSLLFLSARSGLFRIA